MRNLTITEQQAIVGGTKYKCKGCGYTFGYTGYREWLWGSVSNAKRMHESVRHGGKTQRWTTV